METRDKIELLIKAATNGIIGMDEARREVRVSLGIADSPKEKVSAMPNDEWRPTRGDAYWFVTIRGMVDNVVWHGDEFDAGRLAFNNVFKTKEEAEARRDVIKGMCWDDFPEKGAKCEYLGSDGKWYETTWANGLGQQARFRMGTLRVKK